MGKDKDFYNGISLFQCIDDMFQPTGQPQNTEYGE